MQAVFSFYRDYIFVPSRASRSVTQINLFNWLSEFKFREK